MYNMFDDIPRQNRHEMNLDWIIKTLEEYKEIATANGEAIAAFPATIAAAIADAINQYSSRIPANVEIPPQVYGAIGDGVADDGPALLAWMDVLAQQGRIGYLPAGTYRHTAPLKFTGNYGRNWGWHGAGKDSLIVGDGVQVDGLTFQNCEKGHIWGFDLDCTDHLPPALGSPIFALNLIHCNDMEIHDFRIRNHYSTAIILQPGDALAQETCERCKLYDFKVTCVDIDVEKAPAGIILCNAVDCVVHNFDLDGATYFGAELKNYSKRTMIYDGIIRNARDGCYIGQDIVSTEKVFATEDCEYKNITLVNVQQPIVTGRANNCKFTDITVINPDVDTLSLASLSLSEKIIVEMTALEIVADNVYLFPLEGSNHCIIDCKIGNSSLNVTGWLTNEASAPYDIGYNVVRVLAGASYYPSVASVPANCMLAVNGMIIDMLNAYTVESCKAVHVGTGNTRAVSISKVPQSLYAQYTFDYGDGTINTIKISDAGITPSLGVFGIRKDTNGPGMGIDATNAYVQKAGSSTKYYFDSATGTFHT